MYDQFVQFIDKTNEYLADFRRKLIKACEQVGKEAEGYAKKECPVGTPESTGIPGYKGGTLRGSISHIVVDDGSQSGIYIGTNVWYAKYVEYIDRYKHKPPTKAHFLRDAAANHSDHYKEIIEAGLK